MTAKPVPPIPPSPYFSSDGYFIMQDGMAKLKIDDSLGSFWRGIIGAICEVAWLREAERLEQCRILAFPHEKAGWHLREQAARDNASAWRSWSQAEQDTGGARA